MLKIAKVSRRFGSKLAVDGVDLEIAEGQMVGIIGRSGAGKSTLLRMINRLTDPTGGTIHFGDRDVTALSGADLRAWRNQCAMIFQQFNLVPRIDVLTNVLLGRLNRRPTLLSILNIFSRGRTAGRDPRAGPARHRAGRPAARRHAVGRPAAARRHRPGPDAEPAG